MILRVRAPSRVARDSGIDSAFALHGFTLHSGAPESLEQSGVANYELQHIRYK